MSDETDTIPRSAEFTSDEQQSDHLAALAREVEFCNTTKDAENLTESQRASRARRAGEAQAEIDRISGHRTAEKRPRRGADAETR